MLHCTIQLQVSLFVPFHVSLDVAACDLEDSSSLERRFGVRSSTTSIT